MTKPCMREKERWIKRDRQTHKEKDRKRQICRERERETDRRKKVRQRKVVGSFKDSMTRQVSEAVRIELRGEGVLNSKAEFSRCRLPRLVIDQEGWKKSKVQEKKMLEPVYQPPVLYDEENTTAVLAEELDLGHLADRRRTGEMGWKRRAEENNKPAKRKKYSKLVGWGGLLETCVHRSKCYGILRFCKLIGWVDIATDGWSWINMLRNTWNHAKLLALVIGGRGGQCNLMKSSAREGQFPSVMPRTSKVEKAAIFV